MLKRVNNFGVAYEIMRKNMKKCRMVLKELRAEKDHMKQNDINIATEMIKEQVKKIPNWKNPGPDGVQGYWLQKLTKRMLEIGYPEYWKAFNLCKCLTTSSNL